MKQVPDYAKAPNGKINWVQKGKSAERTAHYEALYGKKEVRAKAKEQLNTLFEETNSNINEEPRKIMRGDTLGRYLSKLSQGNKSLKRQGLRNLQSQGYEVDFFPLGWEVKVENNKFSIYKERRDGLIRYYKSPDTGVAVKNLKLFSIGQVPKFERKNDSPKIAKKVAKAPEAPKPAKQTVDNVEVTLEVQKELDRRWERRMRIIRSATSSKITITSENATALGFGGKIIKLSLNGREAVVKIYNKDGTPPHRAYLPSVSNVEFNGTSYRNAGIAVSEASKTLLE